MVRTPNLTGLQTTDVLLDTLISRATAIKESVDRMGACKLAVCPLTGPQGSPTSSSTMKRITFQAWRWEAIQSATVSASSNNQARILTRAPALNGFSLSLTRAMSLAKRHRAMRQLPRLAGQSLQRSLVGKELTRCRISPFSVSMKAAITSNLTIHACSRRLALGQRRPTEKSKSMWA